MKPQNPDAQPEDPAERERSEAEAAERAMRSDHHAFAGAATGVGSVEFDDVGAFGVGARAETPPEETSEEPAER